MKNLSKNFKSGFTLIELLVVVAIIGILASVVLASLNTARAKGADAAIKANLSGTRAAAELFYDTAGNYGTVLLAAGNCAATAGTIFADPSITNAITAAGNAYNGGGMAAGRSMGYSSSTQDWQPSNGRSYTRQLVCRQYR